MADSQHYASPHDSLVELLRCMPRRALVELICRAHGTVLGEITQINERTPTIEIPSLLYRARKGLPDLVLTVHVKARRPILIFIIEGQLSWDSAKPEDWALFPLAFAARTHGKAILAVFCPIPELRARFRVALAETFPPPVLIGPDHIELIDDIDRARREPHLTILGAIYHAPEDLPESIRVAGIRAALIAASTLEPSEYLRHYLLMQSLVPPQLFKSALAQALAANDPHKAAILDRYGHQYTRVYDEGREVGLCEGIEKGLLQGIEQGTERGIEQGEIRILRRTLLDILELRGFTTTTAMVARIESCDDVATLEQWHARARTWNPNRSLDDLLA